MKIDRDPSENNEEKEKLIGALGLHFLISV